jgi:hypothetical protein
MDLGIPAPLSLAVLLFIFLTLILRLAMLNSTVTDKRLNIALVSLAGCCALHHRTVQVAIVNYSQSRLSPELLHELSAFVAIPAFGALFLVAYTWINRSEPRYLARIVYAAVTATVIVIQVLELDAWSKNVEFALATIRSGWSVIAYSSSPQAAVAAMTIYVSFICWFCVMLLTTCIRELRRKLNKRAVAVTASIAMIAVGTLTQTVCNSIAAIIAASGQRNAFIDICGFANRFSLVIYTVIGTGVAAVPAFTRLLERLHVDRYSRRRRRLLPLWRDLTDACPEIVYLVDGNVASNRSRYLLHRTVVEIRDCMLILSRYAGHRDEAAIHAADDNPLLQQTVQLALAWSAKITGNSPSGDFVAQQSAARDLLDEIKELSKLGDHWAKAKDIVADVTHSTVAAK